MQEVNVTMAEKKYISGTLDDYSLTTSIGEDLSESLFSPKVGCMLKPRPIKIKQAMSDTSPPQLIQEISERIMLDAKTIPLSEQEQIQVTHVANSGGKIHYEAEISVPHRQKPEKLSAVDVSSKSLTPDKQGLKNAIDNTIWKNVKAYSYHKDKWNKQNKKRLYDMMENGNGREAKYRKGQKMGLTTEETEAISDYTTNMYELINKGLRTGEMNEEILNEVILANSGLNKLPSY